MARQRRRIFPAEAEQFSRPQYWQYRGAIYIHPDGATNENIPYVDASPRYLAIPPVDGTNGPTYGFPGRVTNIVEPPNAVELYRDSDWWVAIDSAVDTQHGAKLVGGVGKVLALNPGAATIAFVSTVNTDKAVINWLYGRW